MREQQSLLDYINNYRRDQERLNEHGEDLLFDDCEDEEESIWEEESVISQQQDNNNNNYESFEDEDEDISINIKPTYHTRYETINDEDMEEEEEVEEEDDCLFEEEDSREVEDVDEDDESFDEFDLVEEMLVADEETEDDLNNLISLIVDINNAYNYENTRTIASQAEGSQQSESNSKLTVKIPDSLITKIKVLAIIKGLSLKSLVESAITGFVEDSADDFTALIS